MKKALLILVVLFAMPCSTAERQHELQMINDRTYEIWHVIHATGETGEEWDEFILGEFELDGFPRRVKKIIALYTEGIPEYLLPDRGDEYLANMLGGFPSLAEARAGWKGRKPHISSHITLLEITRRGNKLFVGTSSMWDEDREDVFILRWRGGVSYAERK